VPQSDHRRKWKRGRERRVCRPDGTRSPSRCRASRCNAKLKQNYLVPLSYGTRYGAESPRRWGWLSPLGRHSSLLGVHFNASKKRLLKAIFSSEKESGMGICLCVLCADMHETENGVFCLSTLERRVKNLLIYDPDTDAYRFM